MPHYLFRAAAGPDCTSEGATPHEAWDVLVARDNSDALVKRCTDPTSNRYAVMTLDYTPTEEGNYFAPVYKILSNDIDRSV